MTVQKTAFCEVYIKTGNASEAYAASHKDCTSNPDSVRSLASRFIRRQNVAAYIQAYLNRKLGKIDKNRITFGLRVH